MNFSFVIKMVFVSFFVFILLYALNFSSMQKDYVTSNNITVKNSIKKSLNLGTLRAYGTVSFDEDLMIKSSIQSYLINNNINIDKVNFNYGITDNIITVKIETKKDVFNLISNSEEIFSYELRKVE